MLLIALLIVGCSSIRGQQIPELSRIKTNHYYVQHQTNDGRNFHKLIAKMLRDRGYNATSGRAGEHPANADYYVSYVDSWLWGGMRIYLRDLRINVHEIGTGNIIGYGRAHQNSLSAYGMTFQDVIDRALDALLKGKKS